MRQISPAFQSLASRLLDREKADASPTSRGDEVEAAERVFGKLRARLARLLGHEGFDTLLSRAIYLTAADYPFLADATFEVPKDTPDESRQRPIGHLKGLRLGIQEHDQSDVRAGLDALLGYFVWLLSTFIGEDLALRQLRRIWPEVLLDGVGASSTSGPEEGSQ